MAFQSMLNGADCGPSNPLQNLLKHSDRDPSAQYDRIQANNLERAGPSSMRTAGQNGMNTRGMEDADRFFTQAPMNGSQFHMEAMRKELDSATSSGRGTPSLENAWATRGQRTQDFSPAEFAQRGFGPQMQQPNVSSHSGIDNTNWQQQFNTPSHVEADLGISSLRPMGPTFAPRTMGGFGGMGGQMYFGAGNGGMHQTLPLTADGKGKGRLVELTDANWEAEFAKIGEDTKAGQSVTASNIASALETKEDQINLIKDGEMETETAEADADFMRSLENTWKNLKGSLNNASLEDTELAAWEAQYGGRFADPDYDYDHDVVSRQTEITPESVGDFLNDPVPYPFQSNHPFSDILDPLAEARKLLREGAPLTQVALALEAACAKQDNDAEAWRLLGETHAADEKENLAIRAFEKAVACGGPSGEAGWLALAVSWVNEGQELRALATLERWLQGSYPNVLAQLPAKETDVLNPWDRHSRIVDMFLAAARAGPTARQGEGIDGVSGHFVDADVQVGLGVLFYSNSEYERARDCFEAALAVRPDDFLLWNRLGATLANGGSPELAIDAYRKALELRPTFTRAIYNLGVSCLNINCFQEAAEHLLAALSLHRKSGQVVDQLGNEKHPLLPDGDGSDNVWHTLRRAFICMDRSDLATRAVPGADVDSFRNDGFDF